MYGLVARLVVIKMQNHVLTSYWHILVKKNTFLVEKSFQYNFWFDTYNSIAKIILIEIYKRNSRQISNFFQSLRKLANKGKYVIQYFRVRITFVLVLISLAITVNVFVQWQCGNKLLANKWREIDDQTFLWKFNLRQDNLTFLFSHLKG